MNTYTIRYLTLINNNSLVFNISDTFLYEKNDDFIVGKLTMGFIKNRNGLPLNVVFYIPTSLNEVKRAYRVMMGK